MNETFWSLLHNSAHWEFELFLMFIFDVVIGLFLWPFISKHWKHHVDRDERDQNEVFVDAFDALVNLKKYIRESPASRVRLINSDGLIELIDEFMKKTECIR